MIHKASSDDQAFVRSFEACQISPDAFDHAAHVRLAYIYLCEHSVDAAVDRMKKALLSFLAHLGVGESKYHETITRAWIMAVAHFMDESLPCDSAAAFITANWTSHGIVDISGLCGRIDVHNIGKLATCSSAADRNA